MPREVHVTPKGMALWAKVLGEPAKGYDTEERSWTISLVLDPTEEATIQFVSKLEELFKEFHGTTNKVARYGWPFGDETIKDENGREKPTGKIKVNFKRREFTSRQQQKPAPIVVDAKKNPWPADKLIGNGSIVRVAFVAWPWTGANGKGMSLELERVQVIELVSYEAPTADVFAEEEGYVVEREAPGTPASVEPTGSFADKLRARAQELEEEIPF